MIYDNLELCPALGYHQSLLLHIRPNNNNSDNKNRNMRMLQETTLYGPSEDI